MTVAQSVARTSEMQLMLKLPRVSRDQWRVTAETLTSISNQMFATSRRRFGIAGVLVCVSPAFATGRDPVDGVSLSLALVIAGTGIYKRFVGNKYREDAMMARHRVESMPSSRLVCFLQRIFG